MTYLIPETLSKLRRIQAWEVVVKRNAGDRRNSKRGQSTKCEERKWWTVDAKNIPSQAARYARKTNQENCVENHSYTSCLLLPEEREETKVKYVNVMQADSFPNGEKDESLIKFKSQER